MVVHIRCGDSLKKLRNTAIQIMAKAGYEDEVNTSIVLIATVLKLFYISK